MLIAERLAAGTSVLVHCSDGWDRTPQLVALAQLISDPHYRTIEGFEVLVEKEFCRFGHRFDQRCHGLDRARDGSPIFLQFIDAVWQLTQQFPTSFEFTDSLLLLLVDAVYSRCFGNFLENCEAARASPRRTSVRTLDFWAYVRRLAAACPGLSIRNPLYNGDRASDGDGDSNEATTLLRPTTALQALRLWRGLHLRDHVYSGTGGEAAGSGADAACVVSPSPRTEVELLRDLLASKDAELKALIARDRQANATAVTRARLDQMQKESGMRGDGVTGIIVAGVAGDKARLGPVATSALIQRWWRAVRYHGHHAPFCDRALLSVYWRSAMRQFSQRRRHGRQIALLLARGVVRDVVEAAIGTAASRANPLSKVLRKAEMTGKNGGSGGFRPPSAYHTSSSSSTTCVPQSFIMIHRSHDPPPPPPPLLLTCACHTSHLSTVPSG